MAADPGSLSVSKSLGQSVVVENVNGAGGTVGATKVACSAPNTRKAGVTAD